MSLLNSVVQDASVKPEEEKDTLGGSSFTVESGLHNFIIEAAFITQSAGGALALNKHLKKDDGSALVRLTTYFTNKNKEAFYIDKKDGTKKPLPGKSQMDTFCKTITGSGLLEQPPAEERVLKLYDFTQGKEVNTTVEMIMSLVGQPVTLGMLKVIENKNTKGADGKYHPAFDPKTGEPLTREVNEISKVFRASDGLTLKEITDGATEAKFRAEWAAKNEGKTKDKVIRTKPAGAPTAGAPGAAAPAAENLFV